MSSQADVVVREYMQRLEWRLAALPHDRREEILAEVREHIGESLPKDGSATSEDAVAVIEQLGDPAEIGDEAAPLNFGTLSPQQADGAGNKYMRRYMGRLRRRLWLLPAERREQILADMQEQIDASLPKDGSASRQDAEALVERLGDRENIAQDAFRRYGAQLNRRFVAFFVAWMAVSGLFFYFVGGVLAQLPLIALIAFSTPIRSASDRVQAAIYLLAACLALLLGWLDEGTLVIGLIQCAAFFPILLALEVYYRSRPASQPADVAVKKYMRRLRRRLRRLPREQREEILTGVREHIYESLPQDGSATREDAQTLIGRLGGSAEIADDAVQRLRGG